MSLIYEELSQLPLNLINMSVSPYESNMQSDNEDWETSSSVSNTFSTEPALPPIPPLPPLLPIPADVSRPDNKLCDTCKDLGLTPHRFVVRPEDKESKKGKKPISLGLVADINSRAKTCPFCRLVLRALSIENVPVTEDGEPVCVDLSWSTDGPRPDPSAPWHHEPEVRLLRPSTRKLTGGYVHAAELNLFPEITLLANDSPTSSTTYFVRPICEDNIDFDIVRRWLAICESRHGRTCREIPAIAELGRSHPVEEIPDFRCIDVEQNCVVIAPSGCRYTALSYVWGRKEFFTASQDNISELEVPGSLTPGRFLDLVPQTVNDAMQVTREIGIRYLWVDSLCIVQDHPGEHKTTTIKMMDLVYSVAFLVIVVGGGANAFSGIAGVRPGTRGTRQPIEEIGPGFRLAFNSKWQDYIKNAAYYTRGWTFQETHFATRELTFIGGQVVFCCQAVSDWQEHQLETEAEINGNGGHHTYDGDDIGEFEGLIQTYSERVLSYDRDIYNAFAAIANRISFRLNTDLCHGIPTVYFDWFLLWEPLADQTRRAIAPSWSWAGWVGGSFPHIWDWYNRSIRRIQEAIQHRTWIVWYHRVSHDSTECLPVQTFQQSLFSGTSIKQMCLDTQSRQRFAELDCSRTEPTKMTLCKETTPYYVNDILSKEPGSGFLQFWTVSMKLRIDEPVTAAEKPGRSHTRKRLGIFGRSGRQLGTVSVQKEWCAKNTVPDEREFILLCEGRDERAHDGRIDAEDGWRYMAMLIEWRGDGTYAERVAVGSIGKGDLREALHDGCVWKEIILG